MTAERVIDPTRLEVEFADLYVLATGGGDVFVLNWNEELSPPPFTIFVSENQFLYQGHTYLVNGHGAILPQWVAEQELAGKLVMFVEREGRLMAYATATEGEAEEESQSE